MSDKNKKITYIDGKFTVYGKEITMMDGMYCLNDLFSAMDEQGIERQQLGQYVRNKSFLRLVECTTGIKICNVTFVISKLREKNEYEQLMIEKDLIDAAYSMLCWAIENKFVETNKNE